MPGVGMNMTPMAAASNRLSAYDPDAAEATTASAAAGAVAGRGAAGWRGRRRWRRPRWPRRRRAGGPVASRRRKRPRVVLAFPSNPDDMLLSGVLVGGQALANRAQVVDIPVGQGHVVMFAIRPFWRWQTQGTFFLGFNTILNWNDLDAGKATDAGDVDAVARRGSGLAGSGLGRLGYRQ